MKILVLDYASEYGGAKTISDYFNKEVLKDKHNEWLFITSKRRVYESKHVKGMTFPFIKYSILHRIYFEFVTLKRMIKKLQPDCIVSLLNYGVSGFSGKQILYVHQALAFINESYKQSDSMLKRLKMNILKKKIRKSVSDADCIIVQTNEMKKLVEPYNDQVQACQPKLFTSYPEVHDEAIHLFYPTNTENYKRFDLIVKVGQAIKKFQIPSYIQITLNGDETRSIKRMFKQCRKEKLPVRFIGSIDCLKMQTYYRSNHLLFTSEVESTGLPLIESMHYGAKILALKQAVTEELLEHYPHQFLFNDTNLEQQVLNFYNYPIISTKGMNIQAKSILDILGKQGYVIR